MQMLTQILAGTPFWVFALFALLLWLGGRQLVAHQVNLRRATMLPFAMTALSIYGMLSVFSHQPVALLGWAVAALMTGIVVLQRALPDSARYDAAQRRIHLAGTAVPLALMMGIFFTKYVVSVQIAMHPLLSNDRVFALCVGALYGAFSGIFAARGLRLWRLARRDGRSASSTSLA
jgi:fucose 4-O-acetylase-like acetyltransferase